MRSPLRSAHRTDSIVCLSTLKQDAMDGERKKPRTLKKLTPVKGLLTPSGQKQAPSLPYPLPPTFSSHFPEELD